VTDDDACDPLDEFGGHNLEGLEEGGLFLAGYLPATIPDAVTDLFVVAGGGHWGLILPVTATIRGDYRFPFHGVLPTGKYRVLISPLASLSEPVPDQKPYRLFSPPLAILP